MDRQTPLVDRPGFVHDMRSIRITPEVTRDENGWYKSQMPLEFDGVPVGKVVEQWLSKVRGALRGPDSRVLLAGCQKRNLDPEGRFDYRDQHGRDRIVWWESQRRSDNKRATSVIPSRVALLITLRFLRHSLSDALEAQAKQRGIVSPGGQGTLLSARDARLLLQLGFMDAAELQQRLRPAIPSPIATLMRSASPMAIASARTLMEGQIHKLVQGDDIPAPLEPVPVLPPIFDSNGEPMVRKTAQEAPVKKKRVIVNKHMGPVQRVLMQNRAVALDRSINRTERARQLIDACHKAGRTKTSLTSLAIAIRQFEEQNHDPANAALAAAAEVTQAPDPTVPAASTSATDDRPAENSMIGKVRALIEEQRTELKAAQLKAAQAQEHVTLAAVAQEEIAALVASAIVQARGEAVVALEETLARMKL